MMRGARVRTKTLFSLMDPEGRASYKISLVLKKIPCICYFENCVSVQSCFLSLCMPILALHSVLSRHEIHMSKSQCHYIWKYGFCRGN